MTEKEIILEIKKKDGSTEKAKFVIRIPTIGDIIKIKNVASSLSGGFPVDPETKDFNERIAKLMVLLKEKPEWFDIENLSLDYLSVIDKLNEIIDKEINFFRLVEVSEQG